MGNKGRMRKVVKFGQTKTHKLKRSPQCSRAKQNKNIRKKRSVRSSPVLDSIFLLLRTVPSSHLISVNNYQFVKKLRWFLSAISPHLSWSLIWQLRTGATPAHVGAFPFRKLILELETTCTKTAPGGHVRLLLPLFLLTLQHFHFFFLILR